MEEYNKIYPEVPKENPKEAPKDGKTFRLQQSCRVLENLEKEAKHYASVRKKYKRCLNVLSRISTSTGTLSFCLSGSGVGTAFSGVGIEENIIWCRYRGKYHRRSAVIKQDGCHFLSLNEIDVKTGVNTHILTFTARYG